MEISVTYTEPGEQLLAQLEVPDGTNVGQAIERAGVLKRFPELDLATQRVGIFGKVVKLDTPLRAGDRVEIYRPIICDPQTVPRRDAQDSEE